MKFAGSQENSHIHSQNMKLKQIVFNSLPRSKSKQKKKKQEEQLKLQQQQQQQQQQQKQQQQQQQQSTTCLPLPKASTRERHQPFSRVCDPLTEEEEVGHMIPVTANKDTTPAGGPQCTGVRPPLPPETLNINNINKETTASTATTKCACYKHLNPLDRTEGQKEGGYSSVSSTEDSGFISLPKTRTLIKTNPWLPSPRSSPATTPDVSPTSSSSPSPVYTDRHPFPRASPPERAAPVKRKKKRRERMSEQHTALNIPVSPCPALYVNLNCVAGTDSAPSSDESDSGLRQSSLSESDNGGVGSSSPGVEARSPVDLNHNTTEQYTPHCLQHLVGSPQTSCSGIDGQDIEQIITCAPLITPVSFEYEEAFESQLEVKGVGQYVGSRDELSDDSGDRLFTDPLGSRAHDFDSEYCPSVYDSSPVTDYDSETESDETVCDDYYTATGFRGHGRPGPFNDLFRDYYNYDRSDGDESDRENSDNSWEGEKLALTSGSPELSSSGLGLGRPSAMSQMRLSLAQKVSRLRREKLIVDEKVQEAQEAEQLRLQERKRLRKEVNLHRKQLLLRTLQDLRSKLEEQSARLQQTYSAVLCMQQAVIQDRRQRASQRRQPPPPVDIREAPF